MRKKPKPTPYLRQHIAQTIDALAPECPSPFQLAILSRVNDNLIGTDWKRDWDAGKDLQNKYNINAENLAREAHDGGQRYVFPKSEVEQAAGWWLNVWRPIVLRQLREHFIVRLTEMGYDLSDDDWWPIKAGVGTRGDG